MGPFNHPKGGERASYKRGGNKVIIFGWVVL
jgi:hypothetical protein